MTLFPYTTLFRSVGACALRGWGWELLLRCRGLGLGELGLFVHLWGVPLGRVGSCLYTFGACVWGGLGPVPGVLWRALEPPFEGGTWELVVHLWGLNLGRGGWGWGLGPASGWGGVQFMGGGVGGWELLLDSWGLHLGVVGACVWGWVVARL